MGLKYLRNKAGRRPRKRTVQSFFFGSLAFLGLVAVVATGGGGGGGDAPSTGGGSSSGAIIGVAAKGLLNGADVTAYKVNDNGTKAEVLGTAKTGTNGSYSIGSTYSGDILVEVTGGSYTRESDPTTTLPNDGTLRMVKSIAGGSGTIPVDVATTLAVDNAASYKASDVAGKINLISNILGFDISETTPVDITSTAFALADAADQSKSVFLAAVDQFIADGQATGVADAIAQLTADASDGQMDSEGAAFLSAINTVVNTNSSTVGKTSYNDSTLYTSINNSTTTAATEVETVFPLTVTEKVSVADAGEPAAAKVTPLRIGALQLTATEQTLPASSDYFNDPTFVYVDERSTEILALGNEILCSLGQTAYDEMINQGNYRAQIDVTRCAGDRDSMTRAQGSSSNQTSGADAAAYEMWTVNSSRADNASPHIIKAWIQMDGEAYDGEPDQKILARMEITESKSETNPFGIFTLNFKSYPAKADGTADTDQDMLMYGFLRTVKSGNQVVLHFAMEGRFGDYDTVDFEMITKEKAAITRAADGSTGSGTVYNSDYQKTMDGNGDPQESTTTKQFNFAYNADNFLRVDTQNNNEEKCFSRTGFDDLAQRYALYNVTNDNATNGSRVTRNSGFPITYIDNGTTRFGWVGYWGLWFPDDVTFPEPSGTVIRQTFDGSTGQPYRVETVGGKLIRHTRSTYNLSEIKGIPLDYLTDSGRFLVEWDGNNFKKSAQLIDESSWTWAAINPAATLSCAALQRPELSFWSQALGGHVQVEINMDTCTPPNVGANAGKSTWDCSAAAPTGASNVVFYSEETVYPNDNNIPTTLYCFRNCLDPDKLDSASPYTDAAVDQDLNPASAADFLADNDDVTYTFDDMVLQRDSTDVIATSLEDAGTANQWGYRTGVLIDPTTDLSALLCTLDGTPGDDVCGWNDWKLPTYYQWETGNRQWNKMVTMKDAGDQYVTFDAPLMVKYTHTDANLGYAGTKFFLGYRGFDDLQGIPGKCIDETTGADSLCGPGTRWVPEFSIGNGAEVTDAASNTYLVKALEKGQMMQEAAGQCDALSAAALALPDASDYADPAIGTEPTGVQVRVIAGDVQE